MRAVWWRAAGVALLGLLSLREAEALAITAAAPVVTQTGQAAWSLGDAAANAIASASRAWATDGIILSATDGVAMAGLGGELALTVTEGATASAAYGAIGACIASVVCGVAAAATVGAVALALRMRAHGDGVGVDGDPGQSTVVVGAVMWIGWNGGLYASPEAACQSYSSPPDDIFHAVQITSSGAHCDDFRDGVDVGWLTGTRPVQSQVPQCPPLSDGTVPSPGMDGLCPTGVYVPMTNDDVAARLRAGGGLGTAQVAQAAEQAVDVGGMAMSATSSKISGPGTQVGPTTQVQTTTSTDAAGHTTTATTTSTPTYSYTYGATGVTASTATTTTTANSDGSSTSTTTGPGPGAGTGTGAGSSPGTGSSSSGSDTQGLCAEYPDILACGKFGDPPTDVVPVSSTSAPSYAAESVSLPVGCPVSSVSVKGNAVSYQPLCDAATQARPWVLVGAAFSALMLIVAVVRTM